MRFTTNALALIFLILPVLAVPSMALEVKPGGAMGDTILFHEKGAAGETAVVLLADGRTKSLAVNGRETGWTGDGTARRASYPFIIAPAKAKRALVIGLTTGAEAAAALASGAGSVDIVVENPSLPKAAKLFEEENENALADRRVSTIAAEPFIWTESAREKYDVILSGLDLSGGLPGKSPALTAEYFQRMSRLLAPDGMMAQWIPLSAFSTTEARSITAAFRRCFRHVTAWSGDINPARSWIMLLGSAGKTRLDAGTIHQRLETLAPAGYMAEGVNTYSFLSFYITDEDGLSNVITGVAARSLSEPALAAEEVPPANPSARSADNFFFWSLYRRPATLMMNAQGAVAEKVKAYFRARSMIIEGRKAGMTGKIDSELEWYDKAMLEAPEDAHLSLSYFAIGRMYYTGGFLPQAAIVLEKAKKISPDKPLIRFYLGKSYEKMRRYAQAEEEFQALQKLSPGYYERPMAVPQGDPSR